MKLDCYKAFSGQQSGGLFVVVLNQQIELLWLVLFCLLGNYPPEFLGLEILFLSGDVATLRVLKLLETAEQK